MKTKEERDFIIDLTSVLYLLNKASYTLEANYPSTNCLNYDVLLDSVQTALTQCENLLKERL